MMASAETCSREETNQASASVGARDTSFWPSRNDWHGGVSVRRDPLWLPEASRGHAFTRLDENA